MCNFYRKFIPNYASIAVPLYKLLKKNVKFIWSPECDEAFHLLLKEINKEAILALPNYNKEFHLTTDASAKGIGAVLSQEDDSGVQRPVTFISRKLTEAEMKFHTTELKLWQ